MKTKVFYGNQYIKSISVTGKKGTWYINSINWLATPALVYGILCAIFSAYQIGSMFGSTHVVEAKETVIVQKIKFEDIPLLQKICNAEVTGNQNKKSYQFKPNGDIVRGHVTPSDVGYCQINESINNDLARRLGYDIYTEQGNKDFAVHLFLTRGHSPWMASHVSNMKGGWSIE